MTSCPRITVVTCSYNQGAFLEDAIKSVLNQGYQNLEYIIVDGGSRDNSVETIRKYEKELAWWVSEPDRGQGDALAKGFEKATGEIFGWLCSDDILEPGALLEVSQFFSRHSDIDVVFGDTILIDREGAVTRRYKTLPFNRWLLLNTFNYIPQPSTFWRREIYERVGGVDRSSNMAMDLDLWMRFSEITKFRHVSRYWSRMRLYPEAKSVGNRPGNVAAHSVFESRYFGDRSTTARLAARAAAKLTRIAYKAWRGCYWA